MKRIGVVLVAALASAGQAQRPVSANRIRSDSLPAAVIAVDSTLRYLGTQSFVLYDVANVEQHLFAELAGTRVKRLVWVQFEGYLPSVSHTYNYGADPVVPISGRPFHQRGGASRVSATEARSGSDGARVRSFLRDRGLTFGPEVMSQRLVWLLDQPARNELMIIYGEDLTDHNLTADSVAAGGSAHGRWPGIRAGLLERASRVFRVEALPAAR